MHTSGDDETFVTRAQLSRTREAFRLLHGSLADLLTAAGGDRAELRRRLCRTLGPLLTAAGSQPHLERVLDVLPRLDWAQVGAGRVRYPVCMSENLRVIYVKSTSPARYSSLVYTGVNPNVTQISGNFALM